MLITLECARHDWRYPINARARRCADSGGVTAQGEVKPNISVRQAVAPERSARERKA
ncbi:hypothetical protein [Paraburkholderia flagellata]|uniref:hypothetical protein n=1 Tax=Paraburkholderia flagellata TaxID=2883241 RepID=UPI001F3C2C81|nr:hypothetical protein [Paraburkholderia flagellata]